MVKENERKPRGLETASERIEQTVFSRETHITPEKDTCGPMPNKFRTMHVLSDPLVKFKREPDAAELLITSLLENPELYLGKEQLEELSYGQTLKAFRLYYGISIAEFRKKAGLSESIISGAERLSRNSSNKTFQRIVHTFEWPEDAWQVTLLQEKRQEQNKKRRGYEY